MNAMQIECAHMHFDGKTALEQAAWHCKYEADIFPAADKLFLLVVTEEKFRRMFDSDVKVVKKERRRCFSSDILFADDQVCRRR